jgi:hypothetical protein
VDEGKTAAHSPGRTKEFCLYIDMKNAMMRWVRMEYELKEVEAMAKDKKKKKKDKKKDK